ncbi:MAG: DUF2110 family protein [Candidatus Bathyarchaeia archaeon]
MVVLTLLEKVYGPSKRIAWKRLERTLFSITSGVEVELNILGENERGWVKLEVLGEDEIVVKNYLARRFGLAPPSLEGLQAPVKLRGKVVDSGKIGYGVYVDVGVTRPEAIDVLIPLYTLRSQLAEGRSLSTREMIDLFCLHDNLPLEVLLTRSDLEKREAEGEFSKGQLSKFRGWISSGLNRVIILGATSDQVRSAVRRTGASRYIVRIERLGMLEHSLTCKPGTDGPGMIAKIGQRLPRVPLYAFSPRRVKNRLKEIHE